MHVPLTPGTFGPDFAKIAAAITPRTRAIIVNTPHNPSATVFTAADLRRLEALLRAHRHRCVISDEVYEHMVFDGRATRARALSRARGAQLRRLSFGKTYHVTGWKVGYVAAPAPLTAEFRKVHQFNVFTVNTPMQHGAGRATWPTRRRISSCRRSTSASATSSAGLAKTRLRLLPSAGTYFQCVDYSAISDLPRPISAAG